MTCTATNENVVRFRFKLGLKQHDIILTKEKSLTKSGSIKSNFKVRNITTT